MLNFENLHKLNTKEDSTYIHKYLGGICLLNYGYRYINYIVNNTMNLSNNFGLFMIFCHGMLSISSLIFHIPTVRNPTKPMIYPEFRLHSIVFGLRSVIVCFLDYYNFHYLYIIGTCYLTFIFADIISYFFKNGTTTMRNMPFDKDIDKKDQEKITYMHSSMQIGATIFMLGNIETAFSPLFAIQLAAFLMTLVRKSIISSKMWHTIYSITLWLNLILFLTLPIGYIIISQIMFNNHRFIFFKYRVNKYIAWTINFLLFILYREFFIEKYIDNYFELIPLNYIYFVKVMSISYSLYRFYTNYKVLFKY